MNEYADLLVAMSENKTIELEHSPGDWQVSAYRYIYILLSGGSEIIWRVSNDTSEKT